MNKPVKVEITLSKLQKLEIIDWIVRVVLGVFFFWMAMCGCDMLAHPENSAHQTFNFIFGWCFIIVPAIIYTLQYFVFLRWLRDEF